MLVFASFGVQLFAGKLAKCNDPHIISRVRTAFLLQNNSMLSYERWKSWAGSCSKQDDEGKSVKGVKSKV